MTDELTEARAHIAKLREALAKVPIYAAEAQYTDMPEPCRRKQPQTVWDLAHARGIQVAAEAVKKEAQAALSAAPSDCYRQIRAEVLEEAASVADRLSVPKSKGPKTLSSPYSEHGKLAKAHSSAAIDATKQTGRRIATEIRALKDKP